MRDVEKLDNLKVRVAVLKEKSSSKPRYTAKEKEALKASITDICQTLSEVLSDDTLDKEFRERLENETRKQMVLIRKALDDLQGIIRVSKSMLE